MDTGTESVSYPKIVDKNTCFFKTPPLGLNSGYTVKYTPSPPGKWVYFTVYPSSHPNTGTILSVQLVFNPFIQFIPQLEIYSQL